MPVSQQNYHNVLAQIAGAETFAGRSAGEVRLVAVGKVFPAGDIRGVYIAGQRDFGEDYIQKWYEKTEDLADLFDIVWHIVGDVQSDKTKSVAERVCWVHTIGRLKATRCLGAQKPSEVPPLQVRIEVNTAGGAARHGVAPDEAVALACEVAELPNLRMHELMCVAKAGADETELCEAFGRMRTLLAELSVAGVTADVLSMSMSGDMKIAVACGATHVHIGSATFGRRDYSK